MGLDITAYKNISLTNMSVDDEEDYDMDTYVSFYNNYHFDTFEDLDEDHLYTFEDSYDFYAGSYSGYNAWRSTLERFTSSLEDNNAFYELINFSDCEGTIGPKLAKKLANDFNNYRTKADEYVYQFNGEDHEWFMYQYDEWTKCFNLASENGAVHFH